MSDPIFEVYRDDAGDLRAQRRDGTVRCDFCTSPDVRWEYPASPMEIVGHPVISGSDDEFITCERCHTFIERHDAAGLAEFSIAVQRRLLPRGSRVGDQVVDYPPRRRHVQLQLRNVLRFFDARTGPPRRMR